MIKEGIKMQDIQLDHHPQINQVLQLYKKEQQPLRKIHRMLDVFETVIKTQVAIHLSELLGKRPLSNDMKMLLGQGLVTPSRGMWQLINKLLHEELSFNHLTNMEFKSIEQLMDRNQKEKLHSLYRFSNQVYNLPSINNREVKLSRIILKKAYDAASMDDKHILRDRFSIKSLFSDFQFYEKTYDKIIVSRNYFAQGVLPSDKDCLTKMTELEPLLNDWLDRDWLKQSKLVINDDIPNEYLRTDEPSLYRRAYFVNENGNILNAFPIILFKMDENGEYSPVFYHAGNKIQRKVVTYFDYKSTTILHTDEFFNEFSEIIKLKDWKLLKTKQNEFLWPFATSYFIATEFTKEPTRQLDHYFKFFESFAAFNAIILLSSLPNEIYEKHKKQIWTDEKRKYTKVSFGNWVGLYGRLSKIYRGLDKVVLENLPFNKDNLYKEITSKKVLQILDPIPGYRNDITGHGGVVIETVAMEAIGRLEQLLVELIPTINAYDGLTLIYPLMMKKKRNTYEISYKLLEGNNNLFPEKMIKTDYDLETNILYLFNPKTNEHLPILSEFANLIQCMECGHWSMYIYSKISGNTAKYISYQTEIHHHSEEIDGLLLDLI
jgi:hypothetical protein